MTFMYLSLIEIASIVMPPSIKNLNKSCLQCSRRKRGIRPLTPTPQMGHAIRSPNPIELNNHATRYWAL